MLPFLILGIILTVGCFILILLRPDIDSIGIKTPNTGMTIIMILMCFSALCFVLATYNNYYNKKNYRVETLIKTKQVDNVVKSDTLIRIVFKK